MIVGVDRIIMVVVVVVVRVGEGGGCSLQRRQMMHEKVLGKKVPPHSVAGSFPDGTSEKGLQIHF